MSNASLEDEALANRGPGVFSVVLNQCGIEPSATGIDQAYARRSALIGKGRGPSERDFAEILSINADVEAITTTAHVCADDDWGRPLSIAAAQFYYNAADDDAILNAISGKRYADPSIESARRALLSTLRRKKQCMTEESCRLFGEARETASRVLSGLRSSRVALLQRLGISAEVDYDPTTLFYAAMGRTLNGSTRLKLARAWDALTARWISSMEQAIRIVGRSSIGSSHYRAGKPSRSTLERYGVATSAATRFLEDYARCAGRELNSLWTEMEGSSDTEATSSVAAGVSRWWDWPARLRGAAGEGGKAARYDVGHALGAIALLLEKEVGLTLSPARVDQSRDALIVRVSGRADVGPAYVILSLWQTPGKRAVGNHTRPIVNRSLIQGHEREPVSLISCNFPQSSRRKGLSFQNLHSLFHEIGHAIDHLLCNRGAPNLNGLDSVPPFRRERTSYWFEARLYDEGWLEGRFANVDRRALRGDRAVKSLEARQLGLEKAMTALVEMRLLMDPTRSVSQVVRDVTSEFDPDGQVPQGNILEGMLTPSALADSSGSFRYLWGAVDGFSGSARFGVFRTAPVDVPSAAAYFAKLRASRFPPRASLRNTHASTA